MSLEWNSIYLVVDGKGIGYVWKNIADQLWHARICFDGHNFTLETEYQSQEQAMDAFERAFS